MIGAPVSQINLAEPPPSVNNLYTNVAGRGRVKGAAYARWRAGAAREARIAHAGPPLAGELLADVEIGLATRQRFDLDNTLKPIFDASSPAASSQTIRTVSLSASKPARPDARVALYLVEKDITHGKH